MKQELDNKKRKLVQFLADKNILIEPEFLQELNTLNDPIKISELINQKAIDTKPLKSERDGKVKIIFSYDNVQKRTNAQDFINYFNSRYNSIKKILQQRIQLENITSIGKIKGKSEKETISVIGMVFSKEDSKSGIIISLEDQTGVIKIFFSKNKSEMYSKAKDIVLDDIIGISGSTGKNIIFANELYFPDIPITKEIKKSPTEEYSVFISDIHVGSKKFLEDEFMRLIHWLRGELGDERQKEISSKVNYLFITGDSVDGISIYPTQRDELKIFTFKEQYKKLAEYLKLIPRDIKIIICPGQHDIVPVAEPQPQLPIEYCKELYELPNIIFVSNPAVVNIGAREGFPGFDVLMYHGDSYHYYSDEVESVRIKKPNMSERAEVVMKLLLQKRHLAPSYDGSLHIPTETDHLIIDRIPDIFVSGDVHRSAVFLYKTVITGIISSCFQAKTSFQDKVGHVPDPGRIPIINLKTREVKILNFSSNAEKK